jgi:hypothetical protein
VPARPERPEQDGPVMSGAAMLREVEKLNVFFGGKDLRGRA